MLFVAFLAALGAFFDTYRAARVRFFIPQATNALDSGVAESRRTAGKVFVDYTVRAVCAFVNNRSRSTMKGIKLFSS